VHHALIHAGIRSADSHYNGEKRDPMTQVGGKPHEQEEAGSLDGGYRQPRISIKKVYNWLNRQ
jgi:hypothetical protein